MKYYVASDVHGFYSEFYQSLDEAGFFTEKEPHKLILLGDLFDWGEEAVKMQDFILELMEQNKVILIRGNHEDFYSELIVEDRGNRWLHHVINGTYDTALQLTGFDSEKASVCKYDFCEAAKKTPLWQKIIPAMRNYYETRNYIFVHSWIPCIRKGRAYGYRADWRNASETEWEDARWYNGIDASNSVQAEKTVVCGHWHASYGHACFGGRGSEFGENAIFTPYYGSGIIAIDAFTAYSGFVNVLVLEDEHEL